MSRLMSRGAVLTFSRLSNFGVLLISPLLLVRILEPAAYGQYQEFMIYAMLLVTVCAYSVDSSLTYFIPKYEDLEREVLTQTSVMIFAFSGLSMALLLLARPMVLQIASYDFVSPLAAYVFFFVNLNWLEYYWIAKRRTDLVLYYSAARVVIRVSVLVSVAYLTRDIPTILWSLVAVEAFRFCVVGACLVWAKIFTLQWRLPPISERMSFSIPLGTSSLVLQLGRNIGKLFIGSTMGPVALAYYAVASYLLPIVRVIRHSIADVVFPELVKARNDPAVAMKLWQRTNVMFCVLLFPLFTILTIYAELFVATLFTSAYLPAVPVFQIYLLWIVRRCFNIDVLLRTRGKTGVILIGTVLALSANLALLMPLYNLFGLVGPAIAFITSEILLEVYFAYRAKAIMSLRAAALIDWSGVLRVAAGCITALPVLLVADYLPGHSLVRAAFASVAFVAVCWYVTFRLGVDDIGRLMHFAASITRRAGLRF